MAFRAHYRHLHGRLFSRLRFYYCYHLGISTHTDSPRYYGGTLVGGRIDTMQKLCSAKVM